jgi:hypothetical protein
MFQEVYRMTQNIERKWQPMQSSIRDESEEILMKQRETVHTWEKYCSELYQEQIDQKV